jgi:hypothetical protein
MDNLTYCGSSLESIIDRHLRLRVLCQTNYAYQKLVRTVEVAQSRPAAFAEQPNWFDLVGQRYFYASLSDSASLITGIDRILALGGKNCKESEYEEIQNLAPHKMNSPKYVSRSLTIPLMELPADRYNPIVYLGFEDRCSPAECGRFWTMSDSRKPGGPDRPSAVILNVLEDFMNEYPKATAISYLTHIGTKLIVKIHVTSVLSDESARFLEVAKRYHSDVWLMKYNEFGLTSISGNVWQMSSSQKGWTGRLTRVS